MKLSTRSTYGMRALVELALAAGQGPVSASQIAKRQNLSVAYLEQLLHRLKKQGVVSSIRGPRGGYVLAKEPSTITVAQVVHVLDWSNGLGDGKSRVGPSRASTKGLQVFVEGSRVRPKDGSAKDSPRLASDESRGGYRHAQRIAQAVWRCVHDRITQSLDAVTLQDLCDEIRSETGEPLDHRYVFHI